MSFKKFTIIALILTGLLLTGCESTPEGGAEVTTDTIKPVSNTPAVNGTVIESSADGITVTLTESLTIDKAGTYILSGTIADGQLTIDADKADKIDIVLNGVDISCSESAAIYVKTADKVTFTLADGSVNRLANTGTYETIDENNIDAVLFSKEDMDIEGSGTLIVRAASGNGITSKDDLKIEGGIFEISAANHALEGKDAVIIEEGEFTLTAGKDGVHAENSDDAALGYIEISGGTFKIEATGDGIDASAYVNITAGSVTMNAKEKGIAASGDLTIGDGVFVLNADDDAIHSNANVLIDGGNFTLTTTDDGIHADENTTINAGTICITKSYEGIEGHTVDINGGEITLTSSDDGINAAGGNDQSGFGGGWGRGDMFASDADAYIRIKGGTLVMNAGGDGIDSNGALYVDGGEIYLSGPTNSGNGALDYGGQAVITGGTVFAAGAAGMAANFTSGSTQCAVMLNVTGSANVKVVLKNAAGDTLAEFTPQKNFSNLIVSHPDLTVGESYTLVIGGTEQSFTVSAMVSGSGGMGGFGGGGFGGGGRPGRGDTVFPGGTVPEMPQGGAVPEMPQGGTIPDMPQGGMMPGMQKPDRGGFGIRQG